MNIFNKKQKGFTIIELLVVIVVIGILASTAIFSYGNWKQRTTLNQLKSDLNGATAAMESARNFGSGYPATIPPSFQPSDGVTLTGGVLPGGTSFCLVATSGTTTATMGPGGMTLTGVNLLNNSNVEKTSTSEFFQYADLAPIFDACGITQYTISFDIKSANTTTQSKTLVYMQNGNTARYTFPGQYITVTTSYTRQSVTVTPKLYDPAAPKSMLAFYGVYGSGNTSSVKNVKVELGAPATAWTPAL